MLVFNVSFKQYYRNCVITGYLRSNIKIGMLISTCQQRKFEMYLELIMVGVLHIVMAFIHYFQQISSMSKSSQNLLLLIEERGFLFENLDL